MGFFITLLIVGALFILSELIRPKPNIEDAKPAGLGDFDFPTATEGRSVPLIWGTVMLKAPNVVWYGDLEQVAIKEKVKTGMFSSERVTTGFRYRLGAQFALCRGAVDSLLRVVVGDDKELFSGTVTHDTTFTFDEPKLFGGDKLGAGGMEGTLRFFNGNATQDPSVYLGLEEATTAAINVAGSGYIVNERLTVVGGTGDAAQFKITSVGGSGEVTGLTLNFPGSYSVPPTDPVTTTSNGGGSGCTLDLTLGGFQSVNGKTPAYRGTCYLAPDTENIYFGNSSSIKPWKFEIRRVPNGLALTAGRDLVNSADANPANVLYEIMTDTDWGLGYDPADIDTASLTTAGNTLFTEGNGFSYILDRQIEAIELVRLVEEQIDGVVFFDQVSAQWKINLARGDYTVGNLRTITATNTTELKNFSRTSWEDTTNELRVEFNHRDDEYKLTYALAQDTANHRLQGGLTITATKNYPGVKDKTLANQLAWRDLRTLSYPLATAKVEVDRTLFDAEPAEVLAFTDAALGITDMPMRVASIDYGNLESGTITLDLVQDVFVFEAGSFADPPSTGWIPPVDSLLPFDADKQVAFEAPRGMVARDPVFDGFIDKVWAGARQKGPEVGFNIVERHASGTPAGAFTEVGTVFGLLLIGNLDSALDTGSPVPLSTLLLDPSPETQSILEAAFEDSSNPVDLGTNLKNMLLVDDEFMIATSAQTSGGNVQLNNVYRGVLDSVQADHLAGANVFLLFVSGGLIDESIPGTDNVHVKLLPFTASDEVAEADADQVAFTMANRVRAPYPPSTLRLNTVLWDSTAVSLEGGGGAAEDFSIVGDLRRRDFRLADTIGDEVAALDTDAMDIFPTYPAANSTDHQIDVRNDPAGANTFLYTDTFTDAEHDILRLDILKATDGVLPTDLRFVIRSRHTVDTVVYGSVQELVWDFAVSSVLSGQFNFGALDTNDVSNLYTATTAGTFAFTLSSAFVAGDVEYRLNGGTWTTLISATTTSGSIVGVVATDTIEVRHASTDVGALKQLDMNAAGVGQDAYAVLFV